jgi:hypothetical protein
MASCSRVAYRGVSDNCEYVVGKLPYIKGFVWKTTCASLPYLCECVLVNDNVLESCSHYSVFITVLFVLVLRRLP